MISRDDISRITIERRLGSGRPSWSIVMMVEPKVGATMSYKEGVKMAEDILRESKKLTARDGWDAVCADVMAWSGSVESNPDNRGVQDPYEYRVTLSLANRHYQEEEGEPF